MFHRKAGTAREEEEEEEEGKLGLVSNVEKKATGLRTAEDLKNKATRWIAGMFVAVISAIEL